MSIKYISIITIIISLYQSNFSHSRPYDGSNGPHEVKFIKNMEFNIPDRPETFKIQIAIPMGVSSSWLIIFSHGFKCHLED